MDALEWVLVALEGVDVDRFSTLATLQSRLVEVVWEAASQYTELWKTRLREDTQSELDALCRYVAGFGTDMVRDIKPLPYRRPLTQPEVGTVWHRLSTGWGLPPTPPARVDVAAWARSRPDVLVTEVEAFDRAVPPRVLRSVLRDLGVRRVWKLDLPEETWSFEMDLAFVDTRCAWGECYWTPQDVAWVLYVSHEAELVVSGAALVEAITTEWRKGE